jgi:hypothetical protein
LCDRRQHQQTNDQNRCEQGGSPTPPSALAEALGKRKLFLMRRSAAGTTLQQEILR